MAKAFKVRKLSPDDAACSAARRIMRTRLREFYSHWRNPDERPTAEQLHALRIAGKRLRYSADAVRDLYPDRLLLLLNLLRQLQDALGEMQDYETQRSLIEADLKRKQQQLQRNGQPDDDEVAVMQSIINDYVQRQEKRFVEFARLWQGLASKKFRRALRELVSHPAVSEISSAAELPVQPENSNAESITHD